MAAVLTSLDDYLDAALAERWHWGGMDCCFFGGNWIAQATGRDPIASYRGTYDTALGARRLIMARGGLVKMVAAAMLDCGFAETTEADHGDVGVLKVDHCGPHAVAHAALVIRNGPWWMARSLDGIIGLHAAPIKAWRLA